MLDTKLKKTHKLKNLIIALIVILPALILVSLYPQMERAMLDKKEQWMKEWEEQKNYMESVPVDEPTAAEQELFYLQDEFVNYVIESGYYQYATLLQGATGEEIYTNVLEEHGWINDFYTVLETVPYYTEYTHSPDEESEELLTAMENQPQGMSEEEMKKLLHGEELGGTRMTQLKADGLLGYLIVEYDSFGKLANIRMNADERVVYNKQVYSLAKESILQYENNAKYHVENDAETVELAMRVCPRNFCGIYLVYADNERFVNKEMFPGNHGNTYEYEPYYAPHDIYFATGAYVIAAAMALWVFLAAMILPFFKKLETGWEKLFSLPTEITLCIAAAGIALAFGMCALMSYSTMSEIKNFIVTEGNEIALLGYQFTAAECYSILIVINLLGWALTFFLEYICAAQLRQFFAGPKYYIRHRFLGIKFLCWIHQRIKKMVNDVLDIDIHKNLHSSIVKVVLANGLIVVFLCCIWFAGTLGALIYSVVLYVLLKKYGSKLQKQYQSILDAAGQMAEGNLHITLDEDLGIFEPLGEELKGVQQGFAKAVAEEAKSQNMKSELITNVSHDLKTPLTAIVTYVDLLKNPDLTEEERRSYIETLDLKSQRLKVLIEDLFEVSKANSGNVKMNFMEVDIVKLLKEVRLELSDKIEQSNLEFRWNLPDEKVLLNLDGQRTYRIFENLLNNAIKYAMPFTRVYVDIVNQDSEVKIIFKNMSAQELKFQADYLTERFVRGDSARNSEGSGLGLAIAKSFTELQNGQFDICVDGDLFKVIIQFSK